MSRELENIVTQALRVVEGVSGVWLYHLSVGPANRSICGAATMATEIPLLAWGFRGHLKEKYCAECAVYLTTPIGMTPENKE